MTRLKSVCPDCGAVFERAPQSTRAVCDDCRPPEIRVRNRTTDERGYGAAWRRLSERARKLQPFCSDCGSPDDLTADHTVEAWKRFDAGKTIRLKDIAVVCRRCNSARGAARGENVSSRRAIVDGDAPPMMTH